MHATMVRLYEAAKNAADVGSQAELARRLNTTSQRVKNWENRGISQSGANEAQAALGISSTYVLSGIGNAVVNGRRADSSTIPAEHVRIDYLSEFSRLTGPRYLVLPEFLVRAKIGEAEIGNVRWLRAPTPSMAPEIERGSLVFVDCSVKSYAAVIDGLTYAYSLWDSPGDLRRILVRKDHLQVRGRGKEALPSDVLMDGLHELKIYGLVLGAINLT